MNPESISPVDALNNTIWVTSRVRMISERKAIINQNISYFAITYYSVFSIIISIFENYYKYPYPALSQINLSSSVVVLVASLVAAGFRLESRAALFRDCYLKLQKLHDEELDFSTKNAKYRDILFDFPNHSQSDYKDLLINHILIEKKELISGSRKISWTPYILISFIFRRIFYYGLTSILFLAPLIFLTFPFIKWPL